MDQLAYIPIPPVESLQIAGNIQLHFYALCIILGVIVGVWLGSRRWVARGGRSTTVGDIALWAVPFGLVGGRIYHVITDYDQYFGSGDQWRPLDSLKIWNGGLGIWGAIAFGAVGAWIGCRRRGIKLPAYADALAPGIALAQAIGRWGNWFNQELFGLPTNLPWAVHIDPAKVRKNVPDAKYWDEQFFHPTFLYESLWCIGVALLVIWADRKFRLGHGRAFALYVAAYTVGRFWTEYIRIDEAKQVFGMRINNWVSIGIFLLAVLYLVLSAKLRPGREETVEPGMPDDGDGAADGADTADGEGGADGDEDDEPVPGAPRVPRRVREAAAAKKEAARKADAEPDTAEKADAEKADAEPDTAEKVDAKKVDIEKGTAEKVDAEPDAAEKADAEKVDATKDDADAEEPAEEAAEQEAAPDAEKATAKDS